MVSLQPLVARVWHSTSRRLHSLDYLLIRFAPSIFWASNGMHCRISLDYMLPIVVHKHIFRSICYLTKAV